MAGTIYSLALSQRFDSQGKLLIDAPLYLYAANTLTPVDSYRDSGLSVLNPWPLRTDSAGMIPEFWLADGSYRARFTDSAGSVVYFDLMNVLALGPSSGEGGGGEGGGVDPNAIHQTGDIIWKPVSGVRTGWVRANARTIGSASSGATERANADTQPLYEFLWNNFSNDICPVTGGRGANAAADFAANKAIGLIDMRGRAPFGLDDMGSSAAGVITDGTSAAASGGAEKQTLSRSALPNITLAVSGTAASAGAHTHKTNFNTSSRATGTSGSRELVAPEDGGPPMAEYFTSSDGNHTHSVSGVSESINGGVTQTPVPVMNPYRLGTFYIKL